ncbi:hypothetical protein ACFE04_031457 [Oxalis oulophora]
MALEALSCNELMNFIVYDTISATPCSNIHQERASCTGNGSNVGVQTGRKKRKRKTRICKNKEEAESQRMTHIAVERNRRKQMNEHLAVLRSLMPPSYVQRGDQASIVGGAIEFVKELEHHLQSIEAEKLKLVQQGIIRSTNCNIMAPFSEFFVYPQYTWSQTPNKYRINNNNNTSKNELTKAASIADIEVTLVETHANLRILSTKSFRQLSNLISAFHSLSLTILHLNVTTLHPLVLYSISAKVEEGCQLTSVDDIANAVHHMLRIIQDEAASLHQYIESPN